MSFPRIPDTLIKVFPDAIEFVTDTDRLMMMCSCSSSSDVSYQ
jgi:hypothetical protein